MGRPRIAIGGIAIESSTFSPHRSAASDFTIRREDGLLARYDLPDGVEWLPLVHARAASRRPGRAGLLRGVQLAARASSRIERIDRALEMPDPSFEPTVLRSERARS